MNTPTLPIPAPARIAAALLPLLAAAALAAAGATSSRVVHESYEQFLRGEPRGVTLGEEGRIFPGFKLEPREPLPREDVETVWCAAAGKDGSVFLGTGPKGRVLKIAPDGKVSELTQFKEPQVYALAIDKDGALYAGTSPDGKIFRFGQDGKPKEYYAPHEKNIWALQFAGAALFAATGGEGRLHRVTAEGKGEIVYDSDEPNLRCLALDAASALLIGTEGRGLLLRWEAKDRALALFDAPRKEIRQIVVDEKGRVAIAALGDEPPAPKGRKSQKTPLPTPKNGAAPSAPGDKAEVKIEVKASGVVTKSDSASSAPAKSGKGDVFLIETSGHGRRLWTGDAAPLSLLRWNGEWLIGTGDEGFLFAVNDREEERVLTRAQGDQITALLATPAGAAAATSNDAGWWRLAKSEPFGIYDSQVIDSGGFAHWGAVRAQGEGKFDLRTRSGNTEDPDRTWNDWMPLQNERSASPPARYIQYQVQLSAGEVRRVDLFFTPANLRPMIDKLVILPPGAGYKVVKGAPPSPQQKSIPQLLGGAPGAPSASGTVVSIDLGGGDQKRLSPESGPAWRTLVWSAKDINNDELEFTVSVRHEKEPKFRVLEKELEDSIFSLDTAGWADGRYFFKIEVSDRRSNLDGALSDERVSEAVLVDNNPPVISGLRAENGAALFGVRDAASVLQSAEVSYDGKRFFPVLPADGVLDSPSEEFKLPLKPGERLHIRVTDEIGNAASAFLQAGS